LNNGRATGSNGIAPEVLKCARGPVSRDLYSVFIQLWRSGIVPADWQEGITITLHKGKGHQTLCITTDQLLYCWYLAWFSPMFCRHTYNLLSTSLVILSNQALQIRLFGRLTTDAILVLQLLSELCCEFNRPLNVAFLNIKSAFDSIDRTALWKALRSKGTPDIILRLITALHENTGACIRV